MYYMLTGCPFLPEGAKYETFEELTSALSEVIVYSSVATDEFRAYVDSMNEPYEICELSFKPSSILVVLDPRAYVKLRDEWFRVVLDSAKHFLDFSFGTEYTLFGEWCIKVCKGDISPARVYCKDTREDVDSVYLHSIYDSTEEAEEMSQKLNDFAIHNMLNDRYFVADLGFRPSTGQIMSRLRQLTVTPT